MRQQRIVRITVWVVVIAMVLGLIASIVAVLA